MDYYLEIVAPLATGCGNEKDLWLGDLGQWNPHKRWREDFTLTGSSRQLSERFLTRGPTLYKDAVLPAYMFTL